MKSPEWEDGKKRQVLNKACYLLNNESKVPKKTNVLRKLKWIWLSWIKRQEIIKKVLEVLKSSIVFCYSFSFYSFFRAFQHSCESGADLKRSKNRAPTGVFLDQIIHNEIFNGKGTCNQLCQATFILKRRMYGKTGSMNKWPETASAAFISRSSFKKKSHHIDFCKCFLYRIWVPVSKTVTFHCLGGNPIEV